MIMKPEGGVMNRAFYAGFFVTLLVLVFSSCTTAPKHPALKSAQLPDQLPDFTRWPEARLDCRKERSFDNSSQTDRRGPSIDSYSGRSREHFRVYLDA